MTKGEEIGRLIQTGRIVFPDPDWHSFTAGEIAVLVNRLGMPAWWWKPWLKAGGKTKDMKDKPPAWIRLKTQFDESLLTRGAREIAKSRPVHDPEEDFVRKTIGKPPFGMKPRRWTPPSPRGKERKTPPDSVKSNPKTAERMIGLFD